MKPIAATRIFNELPPLDDVLGRKVTVLGSTGSIGESALKVARDIPDRMEIVGLAAGAVL